MSGPTSGSVLTDLRQLLRPYYLVNLALSASFLFLRLTPPLCAMLFEGPAPCELDMRENEAFFFLLIVIMIRARKTGSMNMVGVCKFSGFIIFKFLINFFAAFLQLAYLSSGFMYAKGCNLILFFRADPRMGLVYLMLFILQVRLCSAELQALKFFNAL